MYGSVTDAPRRAKSHGYLTVRGYKGEGAWISDDTPRYITERLVSLTDADAIAEGLADMEDEAYTFGLFEEVEAAYFEESPYDLYERFQADLQNMEWDLAEHWDDEDWVDPWLGGISPEPNPDADRRYDCDGPGMCHICTPSVLDTYFD
jgi:hypothetical protein